jgi:tRNA(fMet)-specific endonuclease VapC
MAGPSTEQLSWLLDTNTLSEAAKPRPDEQVMQRLQQHGHECALPAPVWHELRWGWLRMPDGARKAAIGEFVHHVAGDLPILPYDAAAARVHAELRWEAQRTGRTLPHIDAEIAAIAIARGLTLVTRNLKDFEGIAGLRVSNWFGQSAG